MTWLRTPRAAVWTAVLAASLAGPALALSCLRPDLPRTYQKLDAAEETYVVVHGRLTFDETRLPRPDMTGQAEPPPGARIPARLAGKALSPAGFVTPYDRAVTLDLRCFGPWCPIGESGMDVLVFVERGSTGDVVTLDPCYAHVFVAPNAQMLNQAVTCMRGGPCQPRAY